LVDEAFLRRIPYKIEVDDPQTTEFHRLFEIYCGQLGFEYKPDVISRLVEKHYEKPNREMRRCHPRDLLQQIRNWCVYNEIPLSLEDDYFDRVVRSYFTAVLNDGKGEPVAKPVSG
jgi:hypothetical protein